MHVLLKYFCEGILELLFPSRANCMGCGDPLGADAGFLCEECQGWLIPAAKLSREHCPRCGRPGHWDKRCGTCGDWPEDAIALARFRYAYRRPVDGMIRRMKYSGVHMLAGWMGSEIVNLLVDQAFPKIELVVPVPMHARRLRERGFNHAEKIAIVVAERMRCPMENAIRRTRNTRQQARLPYEQRKRNLAGAFVADDRVRGLRVLLVDDVLTSGATALQCAQALKRAGALEVVVATLAGAI